MCRTAKIVNNNTTVNHILIPFINIGCDMTKKSIQIIIKILLSLQHYNKL